MNYDFQASHLPNSKGWQVKVSGEIDIFNSPQFKDSLMDLVNKSPGDLYIDCTELEYIDSTALGTLVSVLKNVKEKNGAVHLQGVKPSLNKLFKITNLDKVFIIEGDRDE